MAIIIKEIRVNTVIEKKVVQSTDISDGVYNKIKEEVIRELSRGNRFQDSKTGIKKNER